jgi:hypothetical protein
MSVAASAEVSAGAAQAARAAAQAAGAVAAAHGSSSSSPGAAAAAGDVYGRPARSSVARQLAPDAGAGPQSSRRSLVATTRSAPRRTGSPTLSWRGAPGASDAGGAFARRDTTESTACASQDEQRARRACGSPSATWMAAGEEEMVMRSFAVAR